MTVWQTDRLSLNRWQQDDLPALSTLLTHGATMSHWPQPFTPQDFQEWLQRALAPSVNGCARWRCNRTADGVLVGDVGVVHRQILEQPVFDLGYIIHKDFWHMGYGREAVIGAIAWAKGQGISELVANMAVDNVPSWSLAESVGMQRSEMFANPKNKFKDTYIYRLQL
jgi:RimJ/RimL family protein N-acetyltransferase